MQIYRRGGLVMIGKKVDRVGQGVKKHGGAFH